MKRLITLFTIGLFVMNLSARTWTQYDADRGIITYTVTYKDTTINGATYKVVDENIGSAHCSPFAIREADTKFYRYNFATEQEELLFDFGLQVGDSFTKAEGSKMIVTSVCDTIFDDESFPLVQSSTRKCIHLQLEKDLQQKDIWIENVGSLISGINTSKDTVKQRLLAYEDNTDVGIAFVFDEGNIHNVLIEPGEYYEDRPYEQEIINVSLKDDILYLDGYAYYDAAGYWYIFAEEKNGVINLTHRETSPYADGRALRAFSATIGGFEAATYEVYWGSYDKEYYGTIENLTSQGEKTINGDNMSLLLHRQGDVLMAVFPAAEPGEAITLYDASGRVVAKQAIRAGATTAGIDASSLPAGIYIATLASGASTKIVLTK